MKYKIIFCIENFNIRGGATIALLSLIKNNIELREYVVCCKRIISISDNCEFKNKILIGQGSDILRFFTENHYDLIHWFKADGIGLLVDLIDEARKKRMDIPILSTICQKPSYKALLLSPYEILYSNHMVFIDKAAYNDPIFQFIPKSQKSMIYFGVGVDTLRIIDKVKSRNKYKPQNDIIVYGRGSSLNKCPKDMFKVFDKIAYPKRFVIVGNGKKKWILKEIKERNYDVKLIGSLNYEDWIEMLDSFDVFLYYLPRDGYSSIDGTLGEAMLLQKAVVYYGPKAPMERLVNHYNALVAKTKDDISILCNTLAKDKKLRVLLGERARETTLKDFNIEKTIVLYNELYNNILVSSKREYLRIPLSYIVYYFVCNQYYCMKKNVHNMAKLIIKDIFKL